MRLQVFFLLCGAKELEFCRSAALFVAPQLALLHVVNFPDEQFLLCRFCAARDDCHEERCAHNTGWTLLGKLVRL